MKTSLPALLFSLTALLVSACGSSDTTNLDGNSLPAAGGAAGASGGEGGADASTGGTAGGTGGSSGGEGGTAGTGVGGIGGGGSGGTAGAGGATGGTGGSAGTGGGTGGSAGCPGGCDDGIACSVDSCVLSVCKHAPGTCPPSQVCDLSSGCVQAPVCASDPLCVQQWGSDPCKTDIHCDTTTATCTYTLLDNDQDQHAPLVCGGDDCDDADAQKYGGLAELCDGKDNDCNGAVDDYATCPGLEVCEGGVCSCPAANQCGNECVDKSTDTDHCGSCNHACPPFSSCSGGECECPGSQTECAGVCVDTKTSASHCGGCGTLCAPNYACQNGLCTCLLTPCGGACVDTQTDPNNCGSCGNACAYGQCVAGQCPTCIPGGLLILVDTSGSMVENVTGGTKLQAVLSAVTTFAQESGSTGLAVGIEYFPELTSSGNSSCSLNSYTTPDAPIADLPANGPAIVATMANQSADGASVITAVVSGGIAAVREWIGTHPSRKGAIVLINDGGIGIGCSAETQATAAAAASEGFNNTPSASTYVIGVGTPYAEDSQMWTAVAAAGGGTSESTGTQGATAVLAALRAIRASYMCP